MPPRHHKRMIEKMLNGVAHHRIVVDRAGRPVDFVFLELNDAYLAMMGLTREQTIGRRATELLPGIAEDDAGWIAKYGAVALTGVEARFDRYFDTLGRWFSVVAYCPEPKHFVTIFEDITERVEATELLVSSERSLRGLMANLPGMVYRCRNEPSWPTDFVSQRSTELTGYAPERLVGGGVAYGELILAADRERVWDEVQAAVAASRPFQLEYRITAADGSTRKVCERGRAILGDEGVVEAIEGFVMDVTDQKLAEEKALRAQRLESVGRLAGGVAHDFNNMLSVIQTYAELIEMDRADDAALLQDLGEIRTASERAQALTRQLLAFSRRQVLEPVALDVTRTVVALEGMLRPLLGEHIDLSFQLTEGLSSVLADRAQLEQIVMNLCVNARDAMPEGGTLTIETVEVELGEDYVARHGPVEPGRYVMLAVSDSGHGMDEQVQERIFEPFFTTKASGKGTGLGLATVYGIVRQSGGHIWVYSEEGRGTTFKVYLPCIDQAPWEQPPQQTELEPPGTVPTGQRVLVVEDEGAFLQALSRGLRAEGFEVLLAGDGAEAERIARELASPLDLLLTDLILPDIGGHLVAETIRTIHPEVEILYMSGYTENGIVHQGVLDAGKPFLQKPFTAGIAAGRLRQLIRQRSGRTGQSS